MRCSCGELVCCLLVVGIVVFWGCSGLCGCPLFVYLSVGMVGKIGQRWGWKWGLGIRVFFWGWGICNGVAERKIQYYLVGNDYNVIFVI